MLMIPSEPVLLSRVFTMRRYASAEFAGVMCLNVCLSVSHTQVLYQNV